MKKIRTYLKNIFWSNLCVGARFQILNILQYACGLKSGSDCRTLNQILKFEIGSSRYLPYWIMLIVGLLCTLPRISSADRDLNRFLLSAHLDVAEQIAHTQAYPAKRLAAWIDETEARVGINNDSETRLALRTRPKFLGERSAQIKIQNLKSQQYQLHYTSLLSEALKHRYHVLIDLLNHKTIAEQLTQNLDLLKARLELYKGRASTRDFDPEQTQEIELDCFYMEQQFQLHSAELNRLISYNGLPVRLGDADAPWTADVISIAQIVQNLAARDIAQVNTETYPPLKSNFLDYRIAQENYNLAKSQCNSLIKYIELKYIEKKNQRRDSSEVTLSFALPLGGGTSKVAARKQDLNEAQLTLRQSQMRAMQTSQTQNADLDWLANKTQYAQQALLRINRKLNNPREIQKPSLLIRLKLAKLDQQKILWSLHLQALQTYINHLYNFGQLAATPLKNKLLINEPSLKGASNAGFSDPAARD